MNDLQELKKRKRKLEKELNKLTIKYNDNSRDYSNLTRASQIIQEIEELNNEINIYYNKIKQRNDEYKHLNESPAIAARYEAQERLLHLSKEERQLAALNGEKERFHHLWLKANTVNEQTQQEVAEELNRMFRK